MRFRFWVASAIAGLAILLPLCSSRAQNTEYQGLTGGIFAGATRYRLDDGAPPAHFIGGVTVGYRARLFKAGPAVISVTPHVALAVTQFRGISLNSSEIGFSRLDVPGIQVAAGLRHVRPYVLLQRGQVTIERYVGTDLMNYYGSAPSYGFGVELPRSNVCGAGLDIAVRHTSGTLSRVEWRSPSAGRTPAPGGSIGSTIVTVGWSGRFRGTRLLFACS
jgi:hypothetical protein